MKKLVSLLLALLLLLTAAVPVRAAQVSQQDAIATLAALGLIDSADGFEPDRAPTRYEALAMLIRLTGREDEALSSDCAVPYADVERGCWAEKYVGYGAAKGLTNGVSADLFNGNAPAGVRDVLTYALRALGYDDRAGDFSWERSIAFADGIGLTHGEYAASASFLRGDMARICCSALTAETRDTGEKLIEKLYLEGVVSYSSLVLTSLARYINTGRLTRSAGDIYESASAAVFQVHTYAAEEDYESGKVKGTGSGFFITSDGLAVMSYHELDGARVATASTTDGRTYKIRSVLAYDTYRDYAVVRIERRDTEGRYTARFPWLDMGDSAAIGVGDRIYTISSPNGLTDCMSDGIVSTVSRIVDDPEYPCIQITAPISAGSSGGALINEYGEVIGIVFGTFAEGNSLFLCIPLNCIADVDLKAAGKALALVCDEVDKRKAAAAIRVDQESLTLRAGETAEITVTADYPSIFTLTAASEDRSVAAGEWGDFSSKSTVPLTVTAHGEGSTRLALAYKVNGAKWGDETYISVTVLP